MNPITRLTVTLPLETQIALKREQKIFKTLVQMQGRGHLRRVFSVFRLYRYHNISPRRLARLLETDLATIQDCISDAFRYNCDSEKCWAYKHLKEAPDEPQ